MSTTKKVYAWQFSYADAHLAESIRIGVTCKGTGYLGYTAARTWGKVKGVER